MPESTLDTQLRVLVISHGVEIGGIERSLIGLLRSLADYGYAVDLLLFNHTGELRSLLDPRANLLPENAILANLKTPIKEVFGKGLGRLGVLRLAAKVRARIAGMQGRAPAQLPRLTRWAQALVEDVPGTYDVALSFQEPHDFVLRHVDAKVKIGWIHTDYTATRPDVEYETATWGTLDRIAAVSESAKAAFEEVYPELRSRTFVVENTFDPEAIRQMSMEPLPTTVRPAHPGEVTLCTVGRYSHQKAFDVAIDACEVLVDRGVPIRWLAVGYGPEQSTLERLVAEKGLERNFILVGKQVNPYPFMAAADIYVQPSRYEGKAVAVREAQALGKAVLITDFPTASSQLASGEDGLICGSSPDEIATAVQDLIADDELRHRLETTAGERDYSNSDAVGTMMRYLQSLVEAS